MIEFSDQIDRVAVASAVGNREGIDEDSRAIRLHVSDFSCGQGPTLIEYGPGLHRRYPEFSKSDRSPKTKMAAYMWFEGDTTLFSTDNHKVSPTRLRERLLMAHVKGCLRRFGLRRQAKVSRA